MLRIGEAKATSNLTRGERESKRKEKKHVRTQREKLVSCWVGESIDDGQLEPEEDGSRDNYMRRADWIPDEDQKK